MSHNAIVDFLDDEFDGLKVDVKHNDADACTLYQVEVDAGVDMLLCIADACFTEHSIAQVQKVIQSHAKSLMHQNHNVTVHLNADLSCSVG